MRGGGLRQINSCRQVPIFKESRHLGLESICFLVHGVNQRQYRKIENNLSSYTYIVEAEVNTTASHSRSPRKPTMSVVCTIVTTFLPRV
jgi:hypothetical protein